MGGDFLMLEAPPQPSPPLASAREGREPRESVVRQSVMRDLSNDRSWLSINSMTVKAWSLEQLVEGCARAGIAAISPWRDIVQPCGVERAAKLIRTHNMAVTGLCRGGMFPASDDAGRRAALDDNRRAIDEAAAIGAVSHPGGWRTAEGFARPHRCASAGTRCDCRAVALRAPSASTARRDRAVASDVRGRSRLREHARTCQ